MPPKQPQKYLYDALNSCEFLLSFTANRGIGDYENDRAFRSAVERELQIIGEAIMQLDRVAPKIAETIPDHRLIIGFRHVLVHAYDSLRPQVVWKVVTDELPKLKRSITDRLAELEGHSDDSQP